MYVEVVNLELNEIFELEKKNENFGKIMRYF